MDHIPYSATGMIDALKGAADIIEEVDPLHVYFGFCKPGTAGTNEAAWSIMYIDISAQVPPAITSFKWANGLCAYNLVWDDRATYNYYFKKF